MTSPYSEPTEKSSVEKLLTAITGKDRLQTIREGKCVFCDNPNLYFRTGLDVREYQISGMCQNCQDEVFI